jgi:hypothetical protein
MKKIILYYTKEQLPYLKWAHTFFLIKTPHAIELLEVQKDSALTKSMIDDFMKELKQYPISFENLLLIAPILVRPKNEIEKIPFENCYRKLENGQLLVHFSENKKAPTLAPFESFLYSHFEDLSHSDGLIRIEEDKKIMQLELLMNV